MNLRKLIALLVGLDGLVKTTLAPIDTKPDVNLERSRYLNSYFFLFGTASRRVIIDQLIASSSTTISIPY